jgi:hypothetical protein
VGHTASWPLDWAAFDALAVRAHVACEVGLAFQLAHEWTGSPPPPLPVCLAAAAPVKPAVAARVAANLAAEVRHLDRPLAATWRQYDRRRDAVSTLFRAVFVPTYPDWEKAGLPEPLYWAWRPARLTVKLARAMAAAPTGRSARRTVP